MFMTGRKKHIEVFAFLFLVNFNCYAFAHYRQAKLVSSDANDLDRFGVSVAIDGNFAVVGAYQNDSNKPDSGAAYVYKFSGSGWQQQQKLIASDANAGDQFGRCVAIEANTIVVGSYLDDTNDSNTGSAYIFTRMGDVWSQQQKLTAPDANAGDKFGVAAALSSNTVVIGAYGDDTFTGSAYVFVRNDSNWTFQQKLTASNAHQGDHFGYSITVDVNTVLIGAHFSNNYSGSVFYFTRTADVWSQQSILIASDAAPNDYFGCSVALDGNLAVIGAYECEINDVCQAGAAYVFAKTYTVWVQQQKLFDAVPNQNEDFGRSVAIEANTIFAGCPNYLVDGNQAGAVFEFVREGQSWVQNGLLIADDPSYNDNFGSSVATSGPYLIAGAPYNLDNGKSSGSAYIFNNVLKADFDSDCDVDFVDFAVLGPAWRTGSEQPAYNPDCDNSIPPDMLINNLDLDIFCSEWLAGK